MIRDSLKQCAHLFSLPMFAIAAVGLTAAAGIMFCFCKSTAGGGGRKNTKAQKTGVGKRRIQATKKKQSASGLPKPAVKYVTQKVLKSKATSSRTKRVGATKDVKRRVGEYRREGATKNATVYVARSANMKVSENRLLSTCKKAKKCERNQQARSNIAAQPGFTYVIQKNN